MDCSVTAPPPMAEFDRSVRNINVCWSVCLFVNSVDQDCHNGVWKTVNKCPPPRARTQRFRHVVSHDKPGSVRLEASLHHLFCLNLFSEPGLWTGQRVVILKLDKQPPASPAHSNWYLVLSLPPVSQLSSGFRIRKKSKNILVPRELMARWQQPWVSCCWPDRGARQTGEQMTLKCSRAAVWWHNHHHLFNIRSHWFVEQIFLCPLRCWFHISRKY